MVTGKNIRKWILGLSCTAVSFTGCANGPMHQAGGMFSWFRGAPLTEREKQRQEQLQANDRLQDPANLHLKYAQWRENVGDLTDARKSYQVALRENPKSLEAKLGLARLDQLAGRTAAAEEGFQNALKSRPDDPQAQNALGQFYASQKQWNKALPLLEEAADGSPGELTYRHHLAVALAQSGDMQGAFHHFNQVAGEAEAHYNIGYLLLDEGQKEMARQRFLRALALNPNLTQAQAMLDEIDGKPQPTQMAEAPKSPVAFPKHPIQQTAASQPAPTRQAVPVQHMPPAGRNVPTQPTHPQGKWQPQSKPTAPVTPPTIPVWKKRELKETPQQPEGPAYLPPYQAESQTPQTSGAATPPITPAQREQWENQMRAANQ